MGTKHRRIALTADPELEAVIAAARRELGDMPESRLVRELALRGSRELEPDRMARVRAEFEAEGVEWPEQSMAGVLAALPPLEPLDPDDPYRATRILNEVREDTV
ncbi:MAG TPA: hypothetical protein VFR04_08195 [Solirubrobacterales bacterium]|nr:hypothetical protein [Solirubrobacterales bacterium]